MTDSNGKAVWADGFRPADGAIVDAKNVRQQGCSPRTMQGLQEGSFNTNLLLGGDRAELGKYQGVINNPSNHAQYLEIDTSDPSTVGYWQFVAAEQHVKNNVRYVP
jgi:exopolysaccharide biosynthesis protein